MKLFLIALLAVIFGACAPKSNNETSTETATDSVIIPDIPVERTSVKVEVVEGLSH